VVPAKEPSRLRFGRAPWQGVFDPVGAKTHTGNWSFQPEAVEVVVEVTKRQEPSMSKGCRGQFSELTGHNASER
jgi:hypothetical protein